METTSEGSNQQKNKGGRPKKLSRKTGSSHCAIRFPTTPVNIRAKKIVFDRWPWRNEIINRYKNSIAFFTGTSTRQYRGDVHFSRNVKQPVSHGAAIALILFGAFSLFPKIFFNYFYLL